MNDEGPNEKSGQTAPRRPTRSPMTRHGAINSKLFWIAGQIATCDRKRSYKKMSCALIAAHKDTKINKPLHPYRCPVCNEWHLTKGISK